MFIKICDQLGVPLSPHKVTKPAQNTTFLGILLDSENHIAKLPEDKLNKYKLDIIEFSKKRRFTKKKLQSIIGKLSFAASVVPARAFIRGLIELLKKKNKKRGTTLSKMAKKDLDTWITFLNKYNGCTFFRCTNTLTNTYHNLHADACKLGFGGTYQNSWIQAPYSKKWQKCHITVLELFPILVLIAIFGKNFKNSTIIFYTDNMAVKHILTKLTSKDSTIMLLVRKLVLLLTELNIDLRSRHIKGTKNILSDRISRFQTTDALLTEHNMKLLPETIPDEWMPTDSLLERMKM